MIFSFNRMIMAGGEKMSMYDLSSDYAIMRVQNSGCENGSCPGSDNTGCKNTTCRDSHNANHHNGSRCSNGSC